MLKIKILHEEDMLTLGAKIAAVLQEGTVIYLLGSLGAGKTTLTRGILRGLGYQDKVKSPTYTIVEPYHFDHHVIYHFDLYRLNQPDELDQLGISDYFTPTSICIIEWPENGKDHLPSSDLDCMIDFENHAREIQFLAHTDKGIAMLEKISF